MESPSGSGDLGFGNHQCWIGTPKESALTVTIAAQRPQEELSFRTGAVCITYHYLSDRQMVYKGQEPLVCSPVGIRRSGSILPPSCPWSL